MSRSPRRARKAAHPRVGCRHAEAIAHELHDHRNRRPTGDARICERHAVGERELVDDVLQRAMRCRPAPERQDRMTQYAFRESAARKR
jgi:hypothetical protein